TDPVILDLAFGLFTKGPRERCELSDVFKAIEEALWDARKPYLSPDERSGENAAGLILSTAVKGVEHGLFEVVVKARRQIIRDGELVIDRARHSINNRDFPGGLDSDSRIEGCLGHVRRGEKGVR